MAATYRLRKPLTTAPGTELTPGPRKVTCYQPTYEILTELDKDPTASLIVHQNDVDECPEWFEEVK